jgi:hypothetical protein
MAHLSKDTTRTLNFTARPDAGLERLGATVAISGVTWDLYQVIVDHTEHFDNESAAPTVRRLSVIVTAYRIDHRGQRIGNLIQLDPALITGDAVIVDGAELLHKVADGVLDAFPPAIASHGDVVKLLAFLGQPAAD